MTGTWTNSGGVWQPVPEMPIVERFRKVVEATQAIILPYLKQQDPFIQQLHYEHGHPSEIIDTLVNMNSPQEFQYLKYPLIALFQDFTELEPKRPAELKRVRVPVIIAIQGEQAAKAADRYRTSFDNILTPIYNVLMNQIARTGWFWGTSRPAPDKTDRPYWGKEGLYGNIANKATDILDCIELRNLELTIPRTPKCTMPFKSF